VVKIDDLHKLRPMPVPSSILREVPCARAFFELIFAIRDSRLPVLAAEMQAAETHGHVELARAFVVLYKLNQFLNGDDKAKIPGVGPQLKSLMERYRKEIIPEAFEDEGVTHVPLEEDIRVGTAKPKIYASIRPERKGDAWAWLRKYYPDMITDTVNAASLSSLAGDLLTNEAYELPGELFNVALMPNTSVTISKAKKREREAANGDDTDD
jgi:hypothetical protein